MPSHTELLEQQTALLRELSESVRRPEGDGRGAIEGGLGAIGSKVAGMLSVGAIMKSISAGAPAAMNTFTGTLKLASGIMGTAFVPHIVKVSQAFQMLLPTVANLSRAMGQVTNGRNWLGIFSQAGKATTDAGGFFGDLRGGASFLKAGLPEWMGGGKKYAEGFIRNRGAPAMRAAADPQEKAQNAISNLLAKTDLGSLFSVTKVGTGGFSNVEDARKQLQSDALQDDPLTMVMREVQRINDQQLVELMAMNRNMGAAP